MTDFQDLQSSLATAKERSGAEDTDDPILTDYLEQSKAPDASGTVFYRPFLVAAYWIEQNFGDQEVSTSAGTQLTGKIRPITSLKNLQWSFDQSLGDPPGLLIPPGWEAIGPDAPDNVAKGSRRPASYRYKMVI